LQESPETLTWLLLRQEFAALQRSLSPFRGFNEAIFFFEVMRHNILNNFVGIDALLGSKLRQPNLHIRWELDFHGLKIR